MFGYPAQSHVKFNHAPHIRAKVECATCHGDIAPADVAQRNVDLTMGFCVNCHREKQGADRLSDLSLLTMDRRSFIKLTADHRHHAPRWPAAAIPRTQLIRFVPDEDIVPGHRGVEAERVPAVRGRLRPDACA